MMAPRTAAVAALLFTLALITGCSMAHGDPEHPKKNPHPVQRYELIATAKAPGAWDKVQGYITYGVANPQCTPFHKFVGIYQTPTEVDLEVEMTRVSEDTWKGYFYRDYLQDEDYYELGMCHWQPDSISASFLVHGEGFSAGSVFQDFLRNGPQTEYFKVSEFMDHSLTGDGAWLTSSDDPAVAQHPEAFFPITITVRQATP